MEFTQTEYDALPKAENLKEDIKYFPLGFRLQKCSLRTPHVLTHRKQRSHDFDMLKNPNMPCALAQGF